MNDLPSYENFLVSPPCNKHYVRVLSNGIKVSLLTVDHTSQFYMGILFKSGTKNELARSGGVAHFLEHMMFRGSRNFPSFLELAEEFEWLGGQWNAETGYEHTEYSFIGHVNGHNRVIELFSEFIKYPLLLDIEKEREVILREIEDELNEYGLTTDLDWHMSSLFWPNSPLSRPITGTIESVNQISQSDLEQARSLLYDPGNMAISLVGNSQIDSERTLDLVEKLFSDYGKDFSVISENVKVPEYEGAHLTFVPNSDNQHHLQLSFLLEGEWSEKSHIYDFICGLLSDGFTSLLPTRLREELGLVYDITAELGQMTEVGSIDINSSITPNKLEILIREILLVLKKVSEVGPTEKELQKLKKRAYIDISFAQEDVAEQGYRKGWLLLNDKKVDLKELLKKIESLTTGDVKNVAKEIFQKKNMGLVILGDQEKSLVPKLKKTIKEVFS